MGKWLKRLGAGAVVVAGAGFIALQFDDVQDALMDHQLSRMTRVTSHALFANDEGDALKVLMCGTGSPMSLDADGPCVMVVAGDQIWVVDSGDGSTRNMRRWRVPFAKLNRVLITHFHSDHIAELGELAEVGWMNGRTEPLQVFGPVGIEKIVGGFNAVYSADRQYRTAHHGGDIMNSAHAALRATTVNPTTRPITFYNEGGLTVQSISVAHAPVSPAVAYRFDYKGRSVVVSGDTNRSEQLVDAAKGADVLFHDALSVNMIEQIAVHLDSAGRGREAKLVRDVTDYHASTEAAAKVANDAGVKKLFFYHTVPTPPNGVARRIFLRGVDQVRPGVDIAEDGMALRLPVGTTDIERLSFP